ncbi:hypothetical protein [Streptomyces marispadix]|uniref:Uncharacterized protein n=1 Tax=Streptomyces marispadix TaxID=2922868 RepID=A0ABS9SSE8_9ACTN|nr:hypothetical protein [Streptomyces marispadix]MCH6158976.1 hypothetical protein [Streptomyces marispadix]
MGSGARHEHSAQNEQAGHGYGLLVAATPPGKHPAVAATDALPGLAATAPPVLLGTGTGSVVQLPDPADQNTVLSHLRTAAAHDGPLLVYVAGQLMLDSREQLPHLALTRSTPKSVRYTGLPWHWLAAELGRRPAGPTAVFADLVADEAMWRQRTQRPLGGPGLLLYGVLSAPPARRGTRAPEYSRALAGVLRASRVRPPLEELHQLALHSAGFGPGGYGAEERMLLGGAPAPSGGGAVPGNTAVSTAIGTAGNQTGPLGPMHAGTDMPGVPGMPPVPPPAYASPVPGTGFTARTDASPAPPSHAPGNADGGPAAAEARGTAGPGETGETASGEGVGFPEAPSAAPPANPAPQSPPPSPPAASATSAPDSPAAPAGSPPPYGPASTHGAEDAALPGDVPPHVHDAIYQAAGEGRHGEAATMAAQWETAALRAWGPHSRQAVHWVEVRADLAHRAGEPARACTLWLQAASVRLQSGQTPDEADVFGAVDRAHHCWHQVTDPAQAHPLGVRLAELRERAPGRRPGAVRDVQERLALLAPGEGRGECPPAG